MEHKRYKELIQLYIYDEISDEQKRDLENHLLECKECAEESNSLRNFNAAVSYNRPKHVSDAELDESRRELISSIRTEKEKSSAGKKIFNLLGDFPGSTFKFAFGGTALLAAGIFIGFLLFNPGKGLPFSDQNAEIDLDRLKESNLQISNVRFPNRFAEDGEIEVSFDLIKPVSYKGRAEDMLMQQLFANALTTNTNPGVKLRTISTISEQPTHKLIPNSKVKTALIAAVKTDENPGVRREALNVLKKYPYDNSVQDALLFVLSNDPNSGLRIAAINALTELRLKDKSLDNEIRNVLNRRAETDDNEFIRIRAASLLKGVF